MVEQVRSVYAPASHGEAAFLEQYLRTCIHLNDPDSNERLPKPYEYATISQMSIDPNTVRPFAKYVLQENLERIISLEQRLLKDGIDLFNLPGIVQIDDQHFICPPILERWPQSPYNNIPIIVDGAHRLFIAKQRGIRVNCIVISGNIAYPLPVLPLSGWDEVHVCNDVPQDKINPNPLIPSQWTNSQLHRQQFPGSTGHRHCLSESVID